MKKFLLVLLFLSIINNFSFSENEENSKIISITEERKEILLYGIDSEVKELITKLTKEKISGFNNEITSLLELTYDNSLKNLILEYFILMDIPDGEKEAIKILDDIEYEEDYSDSYASTAIKYLSKIKSKEAVKRSIDILETENKTVIISTLKLIGENKIIAAEDKLMEMLEEDDVEDNIYVQLIKTLGEIKSNKSLDLLMDIASDEDQDTTTRNAACYSLGEIGDIKAIPTLELCLADRVNYLLRKSALAALSKFPGAKLDNILIESLRDPQWQIRLEAIIALGERKVDSAFNILKYKALKDPEEKIKKQAFKTIGDINSNECRDFLKEVFTDKTYSDTQKGYAIEKLIEHNLDWIYPSIIELFKKQNLEKRKPVLDLTLKLFSETKYSHGSELLDLMLNHENYIYKLYAINSIKLNSLSDYKDKIKSLSESDKNNNVKKHALSALEEI